MLDQLAVKKGETKRLVRTLIGLGLAKEQMLIEFPTVGYHVLVFFEEPLLADIVRPFMQLALDESGLNGTPFYPRPVTAGNMGKAVQLPFRMNKNTGRVSNLVRDLDSFDPTRYERVPDFSPLEKVTYTPAGMVQELARVRRFGNPEGNADGA